MIESARSPRAGVPAQTLDHSANKFEMWRDLAVALLVTGASSLPVNGFAQLVGVAAPALTASSPAASKPSAAIAKAPAVAAKPTWTELTPMQQQALKPLAVSWSALSEAQKRKWLEISKNYPALQPADQATMHSRMNEWVTLSPQQRAEARLNFAKTKELSKQLTPDEKKAKWQSYQALSLEEKQNLAAKSTKPAGAATAVKPVAPQKLAVSPKNAQPSPALAAQPSATPKTLAPLAGDPVSVVPPTAP